jgi:putative spermidine/putrescine transport system permease protein
MATSWAWTVDPAKDDPPLIIDADRVERFPIAFELLQAIGGRHPQIVEAGGCVQRFELALGAPRDAFEVLDDLIGEEPFGVPIAKGLDHADSYTVYRDTVKIDPSCGVVATVARALCGTPLRADTVSASGWEGSVAESRLISLALVAPALMILLALFVYPLGFSLVSAFEGEAGAWTTGNFTKAFDFYWRDIGFTVLIVGLSTVLIGGFAIAIGGFLTLGENPRAVAALRWLYRWPLFIPFVVAGQLMRTFLAKNGMMNNALVELGLLAPLQAQSWLDWRGIVVTFVWKQTPFVALLVAGAMAALDRATIEAARNLGAGRLRVLLEIVLPQVRQTLAVGLILSFVIMMSVLSVPLMINAQSPTMLTVDMAFRINAYGDYGVANALGFISYLMTGAVAWIYLRQGVREGGAS